MRSELIENLERIHTTILGKKRINKNTGENIRDINKWCQELIQDKESVITKKGKNFYVNTLNYIITINASSYTIITVQAL